ncbi:MAG: hypothetical protein AB8B55_17835 [Mariniblastus sp.]
MRIAYFVLIAPLLFAASAVAVQTSTESRTQESKQENSTTEAKSTEDGDLQKSKWFKITPSDARASFDMPVKPRYVQRTFTPVENQPPITVNLHLGSVEGTATTMVFGYNDLAVKPNSPTAVSKVLDGAVRGSVTNVVGQLLDDPVKIKYEKHMGRAFAYACIQSGKKFVCISRVFIVEDRQYQITAIMGEEVFEKSIADRFLNSFKLEEAKPTTKPEAKDSTIGSGQSK